MEIGERMGEFAFNQKVDAMTSRNTPTENAAFEDVIEALLNFGYSRPDAKKAAERAISNASDKSDIPALVRESLNILSSGGRGRA